MFYADAEQSEESKYEGKEDFWKGLDKQISSQLELRHSTEDDSFADLHESSGKCLPVP